MATNQSVKVLDNATGVEIGLSQLRNQDDQGNNTYSQAVHETPIASTFQPFYDQTNAVRVVTVSDAVGNDFIISNPIQADILNSAIDVSDASVILIYGSLSVLPGSATFNAIITPIGIDDNDEATMLFPQHSLRMINPFLAFDGEAIAEQKHFLRAEQNSEIQYAFHPFSLPTFGLKRIGLHVATYFSDPTPPYESIIIHALKTSNAGGVVQSPQDLIYQNEWGGTELSGIPAGGE